MVWLDLMRLHQRWARKQLEKSVADPPRLTGTSSSTSGLPGRPAGRVLSTSCPHRWQVSYAAFTLAVTWSRRHPLDRRLLRLPIGWGRLADDDPESSRISRQGGEVLAPYGQGAGALVYPVPLGIGYRGGGPVGVCDDVHSLLLCRSDVAVGSFAAILDFANQ